MGWAQHQSMLKECGSHLGVPVSCCWTWCRDVTCPVLLPGGAAGVCHAPVATDPVWRLEIPSRNMPACYLATLEMFGQLYQLRQSWGVCGVGCGRLLMTQQICLAIGKPPSLIDGCPRFLCWLARPVGMEKFWPCVALWTKKHSGCASIRITSTRESLESYSCILFCLIYGLSFTVIYSAKLLSILYFCVNHKHNNMVGDIL